MKKLLSNWLVPLIFVLICSGKVNAQDRSIITSDPEISVEDERKIEKDQMIQNMTSEEKAYYLEKYVGGGDSKKSDSYIEERARKLSAIRKKEELKRSDYKEYVRIYGENPAEFIEIPQSKFETYPSARQQFILDNPQKFKLIKEN